MKLENKKNPKVVKEVKGENIVSLYLATGEWKKLSENKEDISKMNQK